MKKLFIACIMSLGALSLAAQDPAGALSFTAKEMYGAGEHIVVNALYQETEPGTSAIQNYQWEIRLVDDDGNVGEPVFSQAYEGDPSGEFVFPEDVAADLELEKNYQITLTATDNLDGLLSATSRFAWTNYVLTAPKEICCGEGITVNGSFTGDAMISSGMTYQWTVTMCDAQGNSTWPLPYYDSGILQGFPYGDWTVPNSGLPFPTGVKCDQYYRIDLTFSPGSQFDMRPVRRSVIVHMTSFMLTANSNYCSGQYMYATGKYCQGTNSPPCFGRQWKIFNSDNQGNILPPGNNLIPLIPLGGAPNGTSEVIIGTNTLPSGWYVLQLDFLDASNNVVGSRTQLIFINPPVTAAITGSTSCASGSFSATPTGTGYTYQWSAFNGSTPFSGVYPNGSNCYVGTGLFNTVKVTVTSANGCSSKATKNVTTSYLTADFHVQVIPYGTPYTDYYVAFVRQGPTFQGNNVPSDYFVIEAVNPYVAPVSASCWTTGTSWQWPTQIYMNGYNGTGLSATNCPYNNLGHFLPGYTYLATRYVTYNGCTTSASHYFDMSGCLGCRTAGSGDDAAENGVDASGTFDVLPNPSNGAFTLMLPQEAADAQVELVNVLGESVDAFTFSGMSYSYTPSHVLAPGIYLVRLTNNGMQLTKRIVIE